LQLRVTKWLIKKLNEIAATAVVAATNVTKRKSPDYCMRSGARRPCPIIIPVQVCGACCRGWTARFLRQPATQWSASVAEK